MNTISVFNQLYLTRVIGMHIMETFNVIYI